VVGFCGVLIVTNPGANSLTLGALLALINAVMYGSVTVAVRGMTRTESANTLVSWQCLGLAFFHSFLLFVGWRWPSPMDAAMLFGTGFGNVTGQWCWTKALHLAPAPAVTPFYYLMLVWAVAIGFFVWGEVPTISLLTGAAIGLPPRPCLFLREARLQKRLRRNPKRAPRRHNKRSFLNPPSAIPAGPAKLAATAGTAGPNMLHRQ